MLYLNEKKYSDTINDLRLALENRPNDPALLYRLGQAHYLNRSFREALVDLQNSLNFEPDETYKPDIHYHIGLSYANLEDFESSIYPFTLAIEQSPLEAVYYHERAKAYLLTEEYESAVVDFDRVIEFQPNNPHAYFGRAFAHKNMRAYDKAVRSLYQADDFERAKELSPDDPQLIVNYKKIFNIKFIKLCEPGQEMV